MERARKTVVVLRNNWKKSVFASVCALYGAKYAHGKYKESVYMHEICLEAKAYGDAPLPVKARPRHVTVILNPAANDGKCRAMFDKYCGPLLNLAGLKVAIMKTEKEGQAKDIMEIMDNTDAVIVAGGDGTVAEVLTGLMRRTDRGQAVYRFPLALIPLGGTNSVAAALFGGESEASAATRITRATMALVREAVRPLDVMEVQAVETEAEVPGRPVYLLSDITWGAFRDVQAKVNKYWYWGGLKERMAYVFNVFRDLTWSCDAEMEYTSHCTGCSRCHQQQKQQQAEQQQQEQQQQQNGRGTRWWSRFIPPPKPATTASAAAAETDYSTVDNPECGVWHQKPVSTIDWSLRTNHMKPGAGPGLHLRLGPESMTSSEFVGEGWSRAGGAEPTAAEQLTLGQLRLVPAVEERSATVTAAADGAETPDNTRWFGFDREEFEVRPVLIRLLPRAVRVFTESGERMAATS